jgi:type II secretory pathway pseudopilin PulG
MRKTQNGMSLAEVLVGLMILSVMILTTVTTTSTALKLTKNNVNKEFATQKAISMLEELRAVVQAESGSRVTVLDAYDDGVDNKFILTTQGQLPTLITQPGDLISGNIPRGTSWLYERRISVQPVPGQGNDVRFVNVKVFINEDGQQRLLAEVASVLRTLVVDMPPTQVYDVYAVAVENVPGWWVYMSNLVPFVRSTISDLQARNPGLVFRTHWIYTLSYGRDWHYKPYINDTLPVTNAPNISTNNIPWAYFYPGQMPANGTGMPIGNPYYYPWFLFRGVMNKDGTAANTYTLPTPAPNPSVGNLWPYSIADQYNNSMRYEDELAYYNSRLDADPNEQLTWRLLIEKMYSNPAEFTNAIVINLHGELLPFPPVRNYSDAAKSPATRPNIRAVTHPEQLRYMNDESVKLRVYTYRTDPDTAAANTSFMGEGGVNDVPITIKISGTNGWSPAGTDVQIIRGGTDQDATAGADPYDAVPVDAPNTQSGSRMYYTPTTSGTDVILKLFKSPLKHRQTPTGGGGLNPASRLYGLEYIPAPLEDLTVTPVADQFNVAHLGSALGTTVRTARDNFGSNALTNSNGGLPWSTDWIETNDGTGGAGGGRIVVTSGELRIGDDSSGGASTIERGVDLSLYAAARLNFNYTMSNTESGDDMRLDVSADAGTTWTTLTTFAPATATAYTANLTPYMSATTRIRFIRVNGFTNTNETFNVDNLQIEASRPSGDLPKNTARWIITIPVSHIANNKMLTIETRIGDTTTTGVMYPPASMSDPPNLSRTYVWRGTDTWIFGDGTNANPPNLPITEQFQFLGDPRHMPYADLKRPHVGAGFGAAFENRLGMAYNRYFDDFEAGPTSDANSDLIADGNAAAAEITARNAQSYTTTATTQTFAVRVDGGAAITVNIPAGTYTAAQVATLLNGNDLFNDVAVADAFVTTMPFAVPPVALVPNITPPTASSSTRLRIRSLSRSHAASIRYDNAVGNNGGIFGFEGEWAFGGATGVAWPGWRYKDADGVIYGVKNEDLPDNLPDNDAWNDMEIDVHRAFQMVRSALINSSALWTTMTGYSYYYMGIGNEIGYDAANTFPNSIPVSTTPYTGSSGSNWEQTIINDNGQGCQLGCGVKYIRQQSTWGSYSPTTTGWWSLFWIGELYPDSQYTADSNWVLNGNLRAGTGATSYVRAGREWMPRQAGTDLVRTERRTGPRGSTTMFWGETTTEAFHHTGSSGNATILDDGRDIRDNYALPVPDTIPNDRPWQIAWNATGDNPHQFLLGAYPAARRLQLRQRYFERIGPSSSVPSEASALVAMTEPNFGRPAFIVVNGLSPTGITGVSFIAKWSFLTLIQSYLNGGMFNDTEVYTDPDGTGPLPIPVPGTAFHIRQLPRVEITEPNIDTELKNPPSVHIAWRETWTRWDGKSYSNAYPVGCQNTTAGCYAPPVGYDRAYIVLYSPSNGTADPDNGNPTGWFYTDGSTAQLGDRKLSKSIPGLYTDLSTPANRFPEGNYLFRVEEYRVNYPQHYSFHQYRAYIQR